MYIIILMTILLFFAIFIIWEENIPLKILNANVFLTFTCQLSGQNAQILNLNNFHHQTVGNSPQKATDKVRFLKYG